PLFDQHCVSVPLWEKKAFLSHEVDLLYATWICCHLSLYLGGGYWSGAKQFLPELWPYERRHDRHQNCQLLFRRYSTDWELCFAGATGGRIMDLWFANWAGCSCWQCAEQELSEKNFR